MDRTATITGQCQLRGLGSVTSAGVIGAPQGTNWTTATLTLNGAAPAGDARVHLTVSHPNLVQIATRARLPDCGTAIR